MDLGPAGRVVLVTGGADGLGLATADRLAAEGAFLPSPQASYVPGPAVDADGGLSPVT